jgi:copper chaperone
MRFHIENMTCGHCERTIRRALAALSHEASIRVDMRARTIDIEGPLAAAQVVGALADEGYSAIRINEIA